MDNEHLTINIYGMTCAACSGRIERGLKRLTEINTVHINLVTETAFVNYSKSDVTEQQILSKIETIGYKADIKDSQRKDEVKKKDAADKKQEFLFSLLCSLPLVWGMASHVTFLSFLFVPEVLNNPWFQFALAILLSILGSSDYLVVPSLTPS